MTVSELIQELKEIQEKYGDISVNLCTDFPASKPENWLSGLITTEVYEYHGYNKCIITL